MRTIEWKMKAVKQLKKLPKQNQQRIFDAVQILKAPEPEWTNVRKLVNHQYTHRLRVGDYRVLFTYGEFIEVLFIEEVKKRDERTY